MEFRVFASFVLLVLWFAFARKRATRKMEKDSDKFWDREAISNTTRKKSLESLEYISIPLDTLPFFNNIDSKLTTYQESLIELSKSKIVNLTGLTNTDLKITYGAPNLPELTEYDQNFTDLVVVLYNWGTRLHTLGFKKEAIKVLEFGITCHTDISGHYLLLANLYKKEGNPEKIQNLVEAAQSLNSLMKKSILRLLKEAVTSS